ncbi:hypothetical protein [Nostoc sp.]|uniref:hypothetical protein n=1 Tax=Nostoc sp. TaxID=1180 RepID=UPI002FFA1E41
MTKARFQLLIINQVGLNLLYQHQKRSHVQPKKLTERSLLLILKANSIEGDFHT